MDEFQQTEKTKITRKPNRGTYDRKNIYNILDGALFCNLAYIHNGVPFQIPTGFCRIEETIYIHGSVGSFYLRNLSTDKPLVSISVTHLDGLVMARSAMHHSVNYRSVILFGKPYLVEDTGQQYKALEALTEKIQPGRWADIRKPTAQEWKKTMVIGIEIEEASAKIRTGAPIDDDEDYNLPVWAGVIPIEYQRKSPIDDSKLTAGIPLPTYIKI